MNPVADSQDVADRHGHQRWDQQILLELAVPLLDSEELRAGLAHAEMDSYALLEELMAASADLILNEGISITLPFFSSVITPEASKSAREIIARARKIITRVREDRKLVALSVVALMVLAAAIIWFRLTYLLVLIVIGVCVGVSMALLANAPVTRDWVIDPIVRDRLSRRVVAPFLREQINQAVNTRKHEQICGVTSAPGLTDLSEREQVIETAAADRLSEVIGTMTAGSIAISGWHGVGKTTLLRGFCDNQLARPQALGLRVMVSAPVNYDVRDFVLHVFGQLCATVIGDPIRAKPWLRGDESRRRSGLVRLLRATALTAGTVVLAGVALLYLRQAKSPLAANVFLSLALLVLSHFMWRGAPGGLPRSHRRDKSYVWAALDALASVISLGLVVVAVYVLAQATRHPTDLVGVPNSTALAVTSGIFLLVYGLYLPSKFWEGLDNLAGRVGTWWTQTYARRYYAAHTWQVADPGDGTSLRQLRTAGPAMSTSHVGIAPGRAEMPSGMDKSEVSFQEEARRQFEHIRFLQSFTAGYSGALRLPAGSELSRTVSRQLTEQPLTLPELISQYREFARRTAQWWRREHFENGRLIVGIDEIDTIRDVQAAEHFLNDIKAIFGQPHCLYLVCISEDALGGNHHHLHGRDTRVNSAFDEVVQVGNLTFQDTREMLRRRVAAFPDPFIALCHVLSGGLPREVLRAARALVECRSNECKTLPELATALVTREISSLKRGQLRRSILELTATTDRELLGKLLDEHWPHATAESMFVAATHRMRSRHAAERNLAIELYFLATVVAAFRDDLERTLEELHHYREGKANEIDQLTQARFAFAIDCDLAFEMISRFRSQRNWSILDDPGLQEG